MLAAAGGSRGWGRGGKAGVDGGGRLDGLCKVGSAHLLAADKPAIVASEALALATAAFSRLHAAARRLFSATKAFRHIQPACCCVGMSALTPRRPPGGQAPTKGATGTQTGTQTPKARR